MATTKTTTKTATANNGPAPLPKGVAFSTLVIGVPNTKATIPARPGSQRARRWAVLLKQNGNTVAAYYAACRALGTPCSKNNPMLAYQKGLITLSAPTAAK